MTTPLDSSVNALRGMCAETDAHLYVITNEVANLRADVAVFKLQRDVARQAEARAVQKAEDSRARWAAENTAKCTAQSECALAREALWALAAEVTRSRSCDLR